jgi:RNA polymerase sigma-70 factor, ECF subfamily
VLDSRPLEETTDDVGALVAQIVEDRDRARAEASFCARYKRLVYLYGIRHLRDAAAADDLVQDVLSTVLLRIRAGAIEEPAKIGAFVLGTCRMLVANKKRGEARRTRLLALYVDPRSEQEGAAAGDLHDLDRLRECLTMMADRDRTVLLLSFYAELDAAAVGREMGVEPSHVRVIRHRALGRLETCVKEAPSPP